MVMMMMIIRKITPENVGAVVDDGDHRKEDDVE
jgi:hypothetical protein